ncbi:hypothetical protein ACT453_61510, partial [Bacillus sp. D-CC]
LLARLKEKGTIKDIKPDKSFGKPVKATVICLPTVDLSYCCRRRTIQLLARLKEKGTIKDIKPDKSFGKPVKA